MKLNNAIMFKQRSFPLLPDVKTGQVSEGQGEVLREG